MSFRQETRAQAKRTFPRKAVATAASSTGLGWCWSQAGRAAKDAPHLYLLVCEVEVTRSTFFLEHRAVLEGMHAWCQIPEHDGMMATVIVDNAAFTFAFAFALRHVFSSTAKAWPRG